MKRIGIVGAGQAGQRIAVALNTFDDVQIIGLVDPINGRSVLADEKSKWRIKDAKFFADDDDEMMAEGYDGLIIAADPINVIHPLVGNKKTLMLKRNKVTCPILWERPLGFEPSHPKEVEDTVPSKAQSVISFARYGLPFKVTKSLLAAGSLGDIIDFEIYVTLNCGLKSKKWRQIGEMGVTQPIHLLDNAFEQIESMGLGSIQSITSKRQDAKRDGISYDEKWEISVTLDSGVSGRIIGIQYTGDNEFLYGMRSLKIVGTAGALTSSLGQTKYIDITGKEHPITLASYGIDPRIAKATQVLEHFFKEVDGYPENTPCRGEGQALAECLRTWVDSLKSKKKLSSFNISSPAEAIRHLTLAKAAIESATKSKCISISGTPKK